MKGISSQSGDLAAPLRIRETGLVVCLRVYVAEHTNIRTYIV